MAKRKRERKRKHRGKLEAGELRMPRLDLSLGMSGVTRKNEVALLAGRKRMQNPQTATPTGMTNEMLLSGNGRQKKLTDHARPQREKAVRNSLRHSGPRREDFIRKMEA